MTGLLNINRIVVPRELALEVQEFLREVGKLGCEGFAVWAGRREGERTFRVTETVIPDQRPIRTESGIMVVIDQKELHALNVWLHENQILLIAQIHSHPTEAYHSDTDDHLAIATVVGSLSFVVPDFATHAFSLETWAAYRLDQNGRWMELNTEDVRQLVTLVQ